MRLTLRTMLAYLDEVRLAPEDAQTLATKIEESEFATGLVHRIRSATRQLRLGAPKVDAKGMGLDANTVAEYLDNVLAEDRIGDFERVCLESDVHLAEVASCHQILTLVLGVRAEVEPALRDRIYAINDPEKREAMMGAGRPADAPLVPNEGNGQPTVTPDTDFARTAEAEVRVRPVVKVEVPDYLRAARRSSWKPALATVVLALILVAAALMALGNLDENHPVLGPILRSMARNESRPSDADGPVSDRISSRQSGESSNGIKVDPAGPTESGTRMPDTGRGATDSGSVNQPADGQSPGGADQSPTSGLPAPEKSALAGSTQPSSEPPGAAVNDRSSDGGPSTTSSTTPPSTSSPTTPGPDSAPPASTAPKGDSPTGPPAVPPTGDIGRYIGSERRHVLARFDASAGNWYRLPEREVLRFDDKLLVLPSYRPQLAFSTGVQCMIVGPSYVEFAMPPGAGAPVLTLESANVLLDTAGVAGAQIALSLVGRPGVLTFVTPDATVAVSVAKPFPVGQDPGAIPTSGQCRLIATSGQLLWSDLDRPPVTFHGGQEVRLITGNEPETRDLSELPPWIQGSDLREIDLRASRELEAIVDSQRPLGLSLSEQVGHRQIEVAALASSSLCALGEFEPALLTLRSERHAAYWRASLESLQTAMVSQPLASERIRLLIEKSRPDDAALLYRLLLGFNNEQLAAGDDARLVSMLEHRAIDIRVLAFENLRRITDRTYLYRPDRDPTGQRRPLQDWRTTLGKGEIRWPAG